MRLTAVLRGHYAYYGVTGNYRSLSRFLYQTQRAWLAVLRRRGQRPHLPWARFQQLLCVFPLPLPRIVHVWTRRGHLQGYSLEEPDAGKLHVRICEGGRRVTAPLLDQ
jgi:hypothetical protein